MNPPAVKLSPEGRIAVRLDQGAYADSRRQWVRVGADDYGITLANLSDQDVTGWADYTAPNTQTEETA